MCPEHTLACALPIKPHVMFHACRSESQAASDVEDLASVLAEGIAKLLLHARHWSSSSSKGLQVGVDGTSSSVQHMLDMLLYALKALVCSA